MATWFELSRESLAAAGVAMRGEYYRSCVSRSYFAAFAAVAGTLQSAGVSFAEDRFGPDHRKVPDLIKKTMGGLSMHRRRLLLTSLKQLYEKRLEADYRPPLVIDRGAARRALDTASNVLGLLGARR